MKYLLLALVLCVSAAVVAETPAEAFENLVDGFYAGDAQVVESYLSEGSIQMMEMMIMMIQMQPGQAAMELSEDLQMAVSADELLNWTTTDLIHALINSPMMTEGFPPRDQIIVSGCEVQGDSGIVYIKVDEYPEAIPIAMVMEGADWKLSEALVQSEL